VSTADGPVSNPQQSRRDAGAEVAPAAVDTARVLAVGVVLWCVALALTLAVPALHTGARSWWPWSCAVGVAGGLLAILYVRRGRGNIAAQ